MPITFHITNEAAQRHGAPEISKVFDEQGGTIGRAPGNDWVLPDPQRFLSGRHAAIYSQDGAYWLADTSANGVFVNGAAEPVGSDQPVRLNEGDRLQLGDYEISVSIEAAGAGIPAAPPSQQKTPDGAGANALDPLALLLGSAPSEASGSAPGPTSPPTLPDGRDPLEMLKGPSPGNPPGTTPAPPSAPNIPDALDPLALLQGSSPGNAPGAAPAATSAPIIPDALDPLELMQGSSSGKPASVAPAPTIPDSLDPMELLEGRGAKGESAPPMMPTAGPEVGAEADHTPFLESGFQPPGAAEQIPEEWDIMNDLAPAEPPKREAPVQHAPPASDAVTHLASPSPAPTTSPSQSESAASESPPAPAATSQAAGTAQGLKQFFEGAGLDPESADADINPELARLLGQIFRQVVQDLREILMARSELKSGFHVAVTTIRPKENNPLKFSAGGVDEALTNLLLRQSAGYLPALEAFREAFENVKTHQVAMMAGMRASFASLLKRFDPEQLEAAFEANAKRGSLFGNKNARTWELYQEFYQEIIKDADDDFQKLFGEEFGKAYEQQSNDLTGPRTRARE